MNPLEQLQQQLHPAIAPPALADLWLVWLLPNWLWLLVGVFFLAVFVLLKVVRRFVVVQKKSKIALKSLEKLQTATLSDSQVAYESLKLIKNYIAQFPEHQHLLKLDSQDFFRDFFRSVMLQPKSQFTNKHARIMEELLYNPKLNFAQLGLDKDMFFLAVRKVVQSKPKKNR